MPLSLYAFILCLMYLSSSKAETCQNEGEEFHRFFVVNGQPLHLPCPIYHGSMTENNFSVSWYKYGSKNPIGFDRMSRIHQHENYLKFIPAVLEDSEWYLCVLGNSTQCYQKGSKVEVFNYDEGVCYSKPTLYPAEGFTDQSISLQCPHMEAYFDDTSTKIEWFKDCIPLNLSSDQYYAIKNALTITKGTKENEGKYTCEAPYYFNGTRYKLSRTSDLVLRAPLKQSSPAIINPTNNIMHVDLGSFVSVTCTVLFKKESVAFDFIYWTLEDGDLIENYVGYNEWIIVGDLYTNSTNDNEHWLTVDLNFTAIREEDYNRTFFCSTTSGSRAFIMFKHPDPNFQGFLIVFFVSLVIVIVITLILFKIFKVDIVLFYRSNCVAKVILNDGKIYDAYVMYPKNTNRNSSYTMDIFALKVLPEVLERQCFYRLFIFGRDDIPGQATVDVIDNAISQSRRLVIILGNTSSEYRLENDFEQQIAMYDALIRNKTKGNCQEYTIYFGLHIMDTSSS
uniref:Interleukin 1 receptor like 2 n=1 Tax=Leptobrachium leishanense TaxID=445787 RepID=A0A8C5PE93_9ANUR